MNVREPLRQACRDWLKAAASLSDNQVLVEDEVGSTDPPYLTVKLTTTDQHRGFDERHYGESGSDATVQIRGDRQAVVRVKGYGDPDGNRDRPGEWITEAELSLQEPSLRATMQSLGIRIEPRSPMQDVSSLLDTDIEPRFERDFTVYYAIKGDEISLSAATSAEISATFKAYRQQSASDDYDTTITS